ncbi:UNVERIFIED_CONTAM: hypothetical protein Sindi_0733600 [Sesamum indicum]
MVVHNGRGQMMSAFIAVKKGIGRGKDHNSSPTQVLERGRRLRKDKIVLKLGDGKTIAAEVVGSLNLAISDHIRIELWKEARSGLVRECASRSVN